MRRSLAVALLVTATVAHVPAAPADRLLDPAAPPAVAAMVEVAGVDEVCATLRGTDDAALPCPRVARGKVAGFTSAEAYAVTTADVVRYAVVLVAAGHTWRSAPLELVVRACGAGQCQVLATQQAKLRAIKIAGAPAAALELTLGYQHTSDDGARPKPVVTARWAGYQLLGCGGGAAPACVAVAVGDRATACTAKLAAGGTLRRSCGDAIALPALVAADVDVDTKDVLARAEGPGPVQIKHVLVAWDALAPVYASRMDPRATLRSNAQAAALATDLARQLRADPDAIDTLIAKHSEDPGSLSGEPYTVAADTPFVPEFKALALRLAEREVGVVTFTKLCPAGFSGTLTNATFNQVMGLMNPTPVVGVLGSALLLWWLSGSPVEGATTAQVAHTATAFRTIFAIAAALGLAALACTLLLREPPHDAGPAAARRRQ